MADQPSQIVSVLNKVRHEGDCSVGLDALLPLRVSPNREHRRTSGTEWGRDLPGTLPSGFADKDATGA